jgi:hypothetical protein
MSYNGSGTFNINSAGQPVVAGTVISATAFNALTADLGVGLSTAITKDGQTTTTARITFAQGVTSSLTTDSTSTSTGSIITAGGVGIAKALFVGTTLNVTGASTLAAITGTFNGTVGATTPAAGTFTTLTTSSTITDNGGTANGVTYLNGSKVVTSGSALTFDGTKFTQTASTTAAAGLAEFKNSSTTSQTGNILATNDAGTAVSMRVFGSAAGTYGMLTAGSPMLYTGATELNLVADNASGVIKFGLNGSAEQMRLTSTGLGIGTSSPSAKLQAVGSNAGSTSLFERTTASTAVPVFASRSLATSSGDMADGFGPTHAFAIQDTAAVINPISEIGAVREGADNTGGLVFRTYVTGTATTQMRLDSSGNLGLGVTPSAWGAGSKALQINSNLSLWSASSTNNYIYANAYYDGTNDKYVSTAEASRIRFAGATTIFNYAASGSANANITWLESMRIDSSGNLLIGSTTNTTVSNLILTGATRWAVGTQSGGNIFYIVRDSDGVGQYMVQGSTSWTATSDERLKDIIEPITNAASKVSTLRAVIGKFKKDAEGTRRSFLIAQDVQAVLPEAVTVQEDEFGTLGIQYTEVIPLLVAAIQELKAEFDAYKASHP